MSNVPAWKRLGLRVTGETTSESIGAVTHFDGSTVTNKVAKKLSKKRPLEADKNDKAKKPPKRVKVPKSERGPAPVKDQLSYLKQFTEDKENWKFSKQKQNWLLKNIESVPQDYENYLIAYFEDLQGGARTRVEEDLRIVINHWNEYSKKLEEKVNAELYGDKEDKDKDSGDKTDESVKTKDGEENKQESQEKTPSKEYALRCKKLLSAMLEEPVHLEGESENTEAESVVPEVSEEDVSKDSSGKDLSEEDVSSQDTKVESQPEEEDNLIIEDVEVEEYDERVKTPGYVELGKKDQVKEDSGEVEGKEMKEKIEKKEKKEKKQKKQKKEKKK